MMLNTLQTVLHGTAVILFNMKLCVLVLRAGCDDNYLYRSNHQPGWLIILLEKAASFVYQEL
jgi:hypothetical protein